MAKKHYNKYIAAVDANASTISSFGFKYCNDCKKRFACIFSLKIISDVDAFTRFNKTLLTVDMARKIRRQYKCVRTIGSTHEPYAEMLRKVMRVFVEHPKSEGGIKCQKPRL